MNGMQDNKNDNLSWETVNVEHVIQDPWIDFRKCDYRLPNGEVIGPVYNYSKHSFSIVVATDKDGKFICVRQYRHGIDEITTEFPAGAIEYKDKSLVPYITYDNIDWQIHTKVFVKIITYILTYFLEKIQWKSN